MKLIKSQKILLSLLALAFFSFFIYYLFAKKQIEIIFPNGKEVLIAGKTYTISWKSRKVGKVDILLVKDEEPRKSKVIVKDFPAGKKKYQWEIFAFEEPSDRYKIVILESPWKEGKKFDSSNDYFTIVGPKFVSCEQLAIKNNWPFIPSDYPTIKRVFLTQREYDGNLGGLEGADRICQKEAEAMGFQGTWKAFLGDDNISATERLNLDGIFVFAKAEEGLPPGKIPGYLWESFGEYLEKTLRFNKETKQEIFSHYRPLTKHFLDFFKKWNELQEKRGCFRFLASNFEQFYAKLFSPHFIMRDLPEDDFLESFFGQEIWLGRVYPTDRKNCLPISSSIEEASAVSFTLTCQNWTTNQTQIPKEASSFQCYLGPGKMKEVSTIGGMAKIVEKDKDQRLMKVGGKHCHSALKLLCIEQ